MMVGLEDFGAVPLVVLESVEVTDFCLSAKQEIEEIEERTLGNPPTCHLWPGVRPDLTAGLSQHLERRLVRGAILLGKEGVTW